MSKTDHLARAKDYIAKGEDFYRKAAEEIVAAMKEDSTLSYREVGERIGKGKTWVGDLVRWCTNDQRADQASPFGGEDYAAGKATGHAKRVLRDPEQRRQVIESLSLDERSEIVREVSRSVAPPEPEGGSTLGQDLDDAVKADLTAQVSKLVATASRIDVLLKEDVAAFKRIDADEADRLDDDLERLIETVRAIRAELLKHREIGVS